MSCKYTVTSIWMMFEMCRLRVDHGSCRFGPGFELATTGTRIAIGFIARLGVSLDLSN